MPSISSEERLQRAIDDVTRLLERHRLLEQLAQRQEGPRRDLVEQLQHRQNLVELHRHLRSMHPADVGFLLEALPPDERRMVWEQLTPQHAGRVLMEMPPTVSESLIAGTNHRDLVRLLLTLDPEDIAFIADSLPAHVRDAVSRELESGDRIAFDQASRYDDYSVGRYMTHEWVSVLESHSIEQALAQLRALGELPPQTDRIFVVDSRNVLRGTMALPALVLTDPSAAVAAAMSDDTMASPA